MAYLEQSLMPGEEIVYRTSYHWFMPVKSAFGFVLLLAFAIVVSAVGYIAMMSTELAPCALPYVLFMGFCVLLQVFETAKTFSSYFSTEFGVTNRRVLVKTGFLHRRSLEIMLSHVEGVNVDQGLFGRVFGYGTIVITGSGGTKQSFPNINAPFELRKCVVEQIEPTEKGREKAKSVKAKKG